MSEKKASKGKIFAIIAAAVLGIAAIAGGLSMFLTGNSGQLITAADYRVLDVRDNAQRVSVSGNIEAHKTLTLSTRLTVPVSTLDVRVGDRVNADQVVARLDVSELEQELLDKQAQAAANDANAIGQIQNAERTYNQYKELLDSGHNPEINGAQAALRNAEAQYDQLNRDFEFERNLRLQTRDPQITAQDSAVKAAREQAFGAAVDAVRASVNIESALFDETAERNALAQDQAHLQSLQEQRANATGDAAQSIDVMIAETQAKIATREQNLSRQARVQADAGLNAADSATRAATAARTLDEAQRNYEVTLEQIDHKLANSQRAVAQAFEAKKEAATSLETANMTANHQLTNHQAAIDDAVRSARAAKASAGIGDRKLTMDIASAEVRAPFNGLVTQVIAKQGNPAAGSLLTVADDQRLIIHAKVKEIDVAKIAVGQTAEFTTPGTGEKKFKGKVTFVSPAAASEPAAPATGGGTGAAAAAAAAGGAGSSSGGKVVFPIEIEVTGDREGLRLGSTAKTRIVVEEASDKLVVPQTAVFTDGKKQKILIIEEKDGSAVIAEREVTLGKKTDFDVELTNTNVKKGAKVLVEAEKYRDQIGNLVDVQKPLPGSSSPTTTSTSAG